MAADPLADLTAEQIIQRAWFQTPPAVQASYRALAQRSGRNVHRCSRCPHISLRVITVRPSIRPNCPPCAGICARGRASSAPWQWSWRRPDAEPTTYDSCAGRTCGSRKACGSTGRAAVSRCRPLPVSRSRPCRKWGPGCFPAAGV